jgi:hypothetical protein
LRRSLIISALSHVVVFCGLSGNARHIKPEQSEQLFVPVNIVTPAEFTRLKAGVTDGQPSLPVKTAESKLDKIQEKLKAKPHTEAPKPAPKPAPPARELAAAPPPPPSPKPAAPAKPEPAPKPAPKPEPAPKPAPDRIANLIKRHEPPRHERPRQEPPRPETPHAEKSRFDPQRIATLLNRVPDSGRPPEDSQPRKPWRPASSLDAQAQEAEPRPPDPRQQNPRPLGAEAGSAAQMSVNEIDAFRSKIARCWSPPPGGVGNQALVVKLHIELNHDGSLTHPPQVMNTGGSPFFQAAAESAVRAVFECQPYAMPPQKYDQWRDMVLNFDPRQMYGG